MERVQELLAMTFLLHRCTSPLAWNFDSCIGTVLVYFVQIAQCTALSLYRKHSASSDLQDKSSQPERSYMQEAVQEGRLSYCYENGM